MSNLSNVTDIHPDFLSPLTKAILQSRPDVYQCLVIDALSPVTANTMLIGVKPEQLLTTPVKNAAEASAMLGGLYLWVDALQECHEIVQYLIGPTGSFWHAIMHRREGDFSNAKYWYARCAGHRAMRRISAMATDVVGRQTLDESILRIVAGEYNPDALVDLAEEIHDKPEDPRYPAAVRIQQMEWEALFNYCAYEAAGAQGEMI